MRSPGLEILTLGDLRTTQMGMFITCNLVCRQRRRESGGSGSHVAGEALGARGTSLGRENRRALCTASSGSVEAAGREPRSVQAG